jgi:hypothetical protein
MMRNLALVTLVAGTVFVGCGEPTQPHPNSAPTARGFDTVRRILLPAGREAYILRDTVSGTCLLMSMLNGYTPGSILQIVPDSMCGV